MFVWVRPQTGVPFPSLRDGPKPPWNQPQVTLAPLSIVPMFGPDIFTVGLAWLAQLSKNGSGSPTTVPVWVVGLCEPMAPGSGTGAPWALTEVPPKVWPEIRLSAPGVDGPNTVS